MGCSQLILAEGNSVMRAGIQALIEQSDLEIQVINLACLQAARARIEQDELSNMSTLLFSDDRMNNTRVIGQIDILLNIHTDLRIIVVSERDNVSYMRRVLNGGAYGYIHQADIDTVLLAGIEQVACKQLQYISPRIITSLASVRVLQEQGDLKPVDLDVLRLTSTGLIPKEIAQELGISTRTVHRSKESLRLVLGVQNNEQIVDAARQYGLLDALQ